VRTELKTEIAIVLIIKLAVLLMIWRIFFYDHTPVIDPLQHWLF